MAKALATYAALSLGLIAGAGWLLGLVWTTPAGRHALMVSAMVAYAVQVLAFAVARLAVAGAPGQVMVGWVIGVLVRLATLAVYALVIVKAFALAPSPALVGLATFLFVTTLIEPLLLKP